MHKEHLHLALTIRRSKCVLNVTVLLTSNKKKFKTYDFLIQ